MVVNARTATISKEDEVEGNSKEENIPVHYRITVWVPTYVPTYVGFRYSDAVLYIKTIFRTQTGGCDDTESCSCVVRRRNTNII